MSSSVLSGQLTVTIISALTLTVPLLASGLISEKAMNTMKAKPRRALNRMSVNGTKVPSSLPPKRLSSSIVPSLQRGDDIDLGHFRDPVEEVGDVGVEEEILELEDERGRNARHRDVQRHRHAAAHAGERGP